MKYENQTVWFGRDQSGKEVETGGHTVEVISSSGGADGIGQLGSVEIPGAQVLVIHHPNLGSYKWKAFVPDDGGSMNVSVEYLASRMGCELVPDDPEIGIGMAGS